jgi:hypothetical protein
MQDFQAMIEAIEEAKKRTDETLNGPQACMDYAHSDPCGLLFGYFDWRETCLVIEDEHLERRMNTDDVAAKIREKEEPLFERLEGHRDPLRIMDIDPSLMADLRNRHGLRFEPANKTPSDTMMLNRLRVAIIEGRVRVHPRCGQLRHQLVHGVFNKKFTDYQRTEKGGHLDLIDALKYGVLNVRWSELPHMRNQRVTVGPGQIFVGGNPFNQSGQSFSEGVLQRPV